MPNIGDVREAPEPTPAQKRQARRLANEAKNQRRREAKAAGGSKKAADHALMLRQEFGGAFGKAPDHVYETCRVGTTAEKREIQPDWIDSNDDLYNEQMTLTDAN